MDCQLEKSTGVSAFVARFTEKLVFVGFYPTKTILRSVATKDLVEASEEFLKRTLPIDPWLILEVLIVGSVAYVYMLTNGRGNVLYVGATENLKERVYLHKGGFVTGFTKKYNVDRLVYFEKHEGIEKARERERQLKGKTRAKKNLLIESFNPSWCDLSSEIG